MGIRQATLATDWNAARKLFAEYAASLNYDLCFQNFTRELEILETMYGPPHGALLLADVDAVDRACVGVRRLADDVCEMKRLYVQPECRGRKLGLALAQAILAEARRLGYRRMVLDTLPSMTAAIAMYRGLGFSETGPYYNNPIEGTLYMEKAVHGDAIRGALDTPGDDTASGCGTA